METLFAIEMHSQREYALLTECEYKDLDVLEIIQNILKVRGKKYFPYIVDPGSDLYEDMVCRAVKCTDLSPLFSWASHIKFFEQRQTFISEECKKEICSWEIPTELEVSIEIVNTYLSGYWKNIIIAKNNDELFHVDKAEVARRLLDTLIEQKLKEGGNIHWSHNICHDYPMIYTTGYKLQVEKKEGTLYDTFTFYKTTLTRTVEKTWYEEL